MEAITGFPEFLVRYNTDKFLETSSEASEFPASSNYEAVWVPQYGIPELEIGFNW
jgi:hypothetical protein